jgi:hypothetical protein
MVLRIASGQCNQYGEGEGMTDKTVLEAVEALADGMRDLLVSATRINMLASQIVDAVTNSGRVDAAEPSSESSPLTCHSGARV